MPQQFSSVMNRTVALGLMNVEISKPVSAPSGEEFFVRLNLAYAHPLIHDSKVHHQSPGSNISFRLRLSDGRSRSWMKRSVENHS
jgi:hypothetical protein